MFTDILVVVAGGISGALAGRLTASPGTQRRRVRRSARPQVANTVSRDRRFDDADITQAAEQWATAQGHPEAAPLVARKLQLGLRLAEQPHRSRRRWNR
jgi:hypothetical protein